MRRRLWLLGAGAAFAYALWTAYRVYSEAQFARLEQERAVSLARIAALTRSADSLARVADSLSRQQGRDTVRLTRWLTRWDTVAAEARAAVDTARPSEAARLDTVLAVADSTIGACRAALRTCDARVAVESRRADTWRSAYDSVTHLPAPRRAPWWKRWGARVSEWVIFYKLGRQIG